MVVKTLRETKKNRCSDPILSEHLFFVKCDFAIEYSYGVRPPARVTWAYQRPLCLTMRCWVAKST